MQSPMGRKLSRFSESDDERDDERDAARANVTLKRDICVIVSSDILISITVQSRTSSSF